MDKIKVVAADGLRVPKEGRAHDYIGQEPVSVPDTLYYRRLLADGDLLAAVDPEPATKKGSK
ncbi:DUF2635 domain-containing protein [Neisseria musculi]|uniref:DUF2635 domain-containing protein n=1 Tax=Neisseria musculi TaxID=1815583 RepID=A0A7H1MEL6_9NEIS|nr:DUF2635 domain-containing protein [Neisseria musculi]QNT60081.1 hypothetical protein H7A79_1106 [Neisseria musculi]